MPENTPEALSQIDAKLGSRTVEAYQSVVYSYPWLATVGIVLDDSRGNGFHKSSYGLSSTYIHLNPDDELYRNRLQDGTAEERFYWARGLIHDYGRRLHVSEFVTMVFLHELGHADNFQDWIVDSDGKTKIAYERADAERKAQLATLPLGQACSRAVTAWQNNTDGYRDQMIVAGYDEVSFDEQLRANRIAYARLPSEVTPDRFAQKTLETIYHVPLAA